jgi:hypothetical protein
MAWTDDELWAALGRYEQELGARGLGPVAIRGYVDHGRRFLRWRTGNYRPRGVPPRSARGPTAVTADFAGLTTDLAAYEADLRSADLQPAAIHTYADQSRRFVRWLVGEYAPRSPREKSSSAASSPVPGGTGNSSWLWEGNVQAALARYLELQGWQIERLADTGRKERGFDILASKDA